MTAPDPMISDPPSDPALGTEPRFDSRAAAAAAFQRIMQGAANLQKMINFHIVRAAMQGDPVKRVEALDSGIQYAERMLVEFRRARSVVASVSPLVPPPKPTVAPSGSPFQRPDRLGSDRIRPRTL